MANEQKYQWEPDAKFELTGLEYNLILAATQEFLNSAASQRVLLMQQANIILENKLKEGVDKGIVQTIGSSETNLINE
ncbi:MAG: hypothetical protein WCP46_00105 [Alphaproteobacteria bacterium]